MGRVAKEDTGRLAAITEARAKHKSAVAEARKKVEEFIKKETQPYYDELLDAVRLAMLDGHSARQVGMAYGSSDPTTIRKLVDDAGVQDSEIAPQASWRVTRTEDGLLAVRVIAFGQDKQTGEATFTIDDDGENITVVDGDFWMQSLLYKEGIVKEIINAR